MPIRIACDHCGTQLLRPPSRIAAHVFCDPTCRRLFITRPLVERFWSRVEKTATCWRWKGTIHRGYGVIATEPLPDNPRRYRLALAHRVAWTLGHGPIPLGLNVCHDCPGGDNPACVNYESHLFLGTHKDNIQDAIRKHGKPIHNVKLTPAQSRYALAMKGQKSQVVLSRELGVSAGTIQAIHDGITWRDLDMCSLEELSGEE